MNINYDDIIELANQRKDALKDMEIFVSDTSSARALFEDLVGFFYTFDQRVKALDDEGRKMLPQELHKQVLSWSGSYGSKTAYEKWLPTFRELVDAIEKANHG